MSVELYIQITVKFELSSVIFIDRDLNTYRRLTIYLYKIVKCPNRVSTFTYRIKLL